MQDLQVTQTTDFIESKALNTSSNIFLKYRKLCMHPKAIHMQKEYQFYGRKILNLKIFHRDKVKLFIIKHLTMNIKYNTILL